MAVPSNAVCSSEGGGSHNIRRWGGGIFNFIVQNYTLRIFYTFYTVIARTYDLSLVFGFPTISITTKSKLLMTRAESVKTYIPPRRRNFINYSTGRRGPGDAPAVRNLKTIR